MTNILTEAQAAAVCAAMRTFGEVNGKLTVELTVGESRDCITVKEGHFGTVHVVERRGHRHEEHPSQWAFAQAYGQPTDRLLPF